MKAASAHHRRSYRRRGAFTLAAIVAGMVLVLISVTLARLAVQSSARERIALLDAYAEQAFDSARAWAAVHADQLSAATAMTLPLNSLLPPYLSGTVELKLIESEPPAAPTIACRVRILRPHGGIDREQVWSVRDP